MSDLNKTFLSGRITRDAELRHIPSGTAVAEFGIASNRRYGDKEETVFADVTVWGKQAEAISQYLTKGKFLILEARLKYETWEKDGQKRSKLALVAENITFGPSEKSQQNNSSPDLTEESVPAGIDLDNESDIPF